MRMWVIESMKDAPMTPIAAFRDEQMARDFAVMLGDSAVVEQRELYTPDDVEAAARVAVDIAMPEGVADDVDADSAVEEALTELRARAA